MAKLVGGQSFIIDLRKTAGAPNPTITVQLHENGSADGSPLATLLNGVAVTNPIRQLFKPTWDADLLTSIDGSNVELRIFSTPGLASPAMAIARYAGDDNSSLAWSTVGPASGDLVLVCFANDGGDNQTELANFTRIGTNVGASVEFGFYYRICTGAETGNVLTDEGSFGVSAEEYSWHVFKIGAGTWHGTTPPEMATPSVATSGTPDAPSLTPSWGAEDETTFFVAVCRDEDDGIPDAPTGYATNFARNPGTTVGPEIATSWRTPSPAVTTEDPGVWSVSTTDEEYIAVTIAVRPAAPSVPVNTVEISAINWIANFIIGEPKSSSDTITVSVADAASVAKSITVSDTLAVSTSETGTAAAALSSADQAAVATADDGAVAAIVSSADAAAAALSEEAIISAFQSGSDAIAPSVDESAISGAALGGSDALAIAATDTAEIVASAASDDSLTLALADTGTLVAAVAPSDAVAVAASESGEASALVAASDSPAVATVEAGTATVDVASSDIASIATTDVGTLAVAVSSADVVTVSTAEISILQGVPTASADSVTVGTSETVDASAEIFGTDVVGLTTSEAPSLVVTVSAEDQTAVSVLDAGALAATAATSDDITVATTEAGQLAGIMGASASDTLAVSIGDDDVTLAVAAIAADTIAVSATDVAGLAAELTATDEIGVSTSEIVALISQPIASADALSISIAEAGAAYAVLASSDEARTRLSEFADLGANAVWSYDTLAVKFIDFASLGGSILPLEGGIITTVYAAGHVQTTVQLEGTFG